MKLGILSKKGLKLDKDEVNFLNKEKAKIIETSKLMTTKRSSKK